MKTYVVWIEVTDVKPTYKQESQLMEFFKPKKFKVNGSLIITCMKKTQPFEARRVVSDILNCSNTQIRIKYHEKI